MKKLTLTLFAIAMLCGLGQQAFAQDNSTPAAAGPARYFSLGPVFGGGITTFAGEVADGWKIKPRPSFLFGLLSQIDISEAIGFDLGLTYEMRKRYRYAEAGESSLNITDEMGYLSVTPMFNFRNVLLGFAFRLPMSGTQITKTPAGETNVDNTDDLKTAIEFKLGGNIPIIRTTGGTLSFLIIGGYDIAKPFKSESVGFDPGQPDGSLHIGLDYLFNAATMK